MENGIYGGISSFELLTPEDSSIFKQALKDLDGMGFRPFAVAKQVIDGVMRIYLCEAGMVVYPPAERFIALVYIAQLADGTLRYEKHVPLSPKERKAVMAAASLNSSAFGEWNVKPVICPPGSMPQNLATGFFEAFHGWTGTHFEPRLYCGTQVVNGTNHMLICVGNTVTAEPKTVLAKVILHETLREPGQILGHFSVLDVEPVENFSPDGGWIMNPIICEEGELPERISGAFNQAFRGWTGTHYTPMLYCGTQLVNGTNHMFICKSFLLNQEDDKHIVKVILHETIPEQGQAAGAFSLLALEQII